MFDAELTVLIFVQGYVRPEFADKSDPSQLIITSGRHPVITSVPAYFLQFLFIASFFVIHKYLNCHRILLYEPHISLPFGEFLPGFGCNIAR